MGGRSWRVREWGEGVGGLGSGPSPMFTTFRRRDNRETCSSRHHKGPNKAPPVALRKLQYVTAKLPYIATKWYRGVQGVPSFGPPLCLETQAASKLRFYASQPSYNKSIFKKKRT